MHAERSRQRHRRATQGRGALAATHDRTGRLAAAPALSDIAYGPDLDQRYDLYRPTGSDNAPLILMVHGGGWRFDFGRVKFVNAIHSSSLPDGTFGGNPGGFVVESAEGAVVIALFASNV